MSGTIPANPAIYHITHLSNLSSMVREGCLWSDLQRVSRSLQTINIGYPHIKRRRLNRKVPIGIAGRLGDYVPFNFCNRSVMLCAVWKGHADYSGGQDEVVHLVSSVKTAIATGRPWAFTDRHADLGYAIYFNDLVQLREVAWSVMPLTYWGGSDDIKEKRQAEFLVHQHFPWSAVERIGVRNGAIARKVRRAIGSSTPPVEAHPEWYYQGDSND